MENDKISFIIVLYVEFWITLLISTMNGHNVNILFITDLRFFFSFLFLTVLERPEIIELDVKRTRI